MNRTIVVGTRIGAIAQRVRELVEMHRSVSRDTENVGHCANNAIARELLLALCLPDKAFVDVGAHVGSVIDGAARCSRPSKIIAVEAIPAKAEALRRRFPKAIIHSCAVGDKDGELPFFIDLQQSGYSSLHPRERGSQVKEILVPVRRLDDIIGPEIIDVIKIDVEGAELAALRGATAVIARDMPTIMFESGPDDPSGESKEALWEWLDRAGYAVLVPNRVAHNDPGLSCESFLEAHLYPFRTTNFFAVPRGRREEIRMRARWIQRFG